MQYYIRIRGKEFGLFDEDQLKAMKTKGKISRTSEISENKINWFPAENFEFLFPTSASHPKPVQHTLSSDTSKHQQELLLPTNSVATCRIQLSFVSIISFSLLILAVIGLVSFVLFTEYENRKTSDEPNKLSQKEQITTKMEQELEETVNTNLEHSETPFNDNNVT
ncbi:MAG: DUF4339 domain-containing protein, partial [Planctomycetaceae bacterium]|nr:DUF4339 domain-containing protein [Planctomycetaceae bacterium]